MWARVTAGGSGLGLRASREGLLRVTGAGCAGKILQERRDFSAEVWGKLQIDFFFAAFLEDYDCFEQTITLRFNLQKIASLTLSDLSLQCLKPFGGSVSNVCFVCLFYLFIYLFPPICKSKWFCP